MPALPMTRGRMIVLALVIALLLLLLLASTLGARPPQPQQPLRSGDLLGVWVHYPGGKLEFCTDGTYRMSVHDPVTGLVTSDSGRYRVIEGVVFARDHTGRDFKVSIFPMGSDLATFRFTQDEVHVVDFTYSRVR